MPSDLMAQSSDSPAAFLGTAPPVDAGALPQVEAAALLLSEDGALLTSKEGVDSNNSRLDGRQRKKKASWVPSKPLSAALLALLAVGLGASLGATSGLILNKLREGAPPVEGLPSEPPIQPEPPSDDEPFTWPPPPPSEEVETKPFEALATKEEEERQQPPVRPLGEEGEPSKEDVRERLREPPAEREEKPVEKGEGELPEGFPEGEKPGIEPVPVEGTSGVPEGLPEEKTPGVEPVPVEDTSRGLDDVPLRRGSVGSISSDVLAEGFQHEDLYEDVEGDREDLLGLPTSAEEQGIPPMSESLVVEPLISRLKETPFEKPKQPTEEDLRVLEEGLKRDGDHGTIVIGFVPLMKEEIRKFLLGHMTAIQLLDGYSTMLDDHLQQGFRLKYNEPVKVLNPSTLFFKWMQFTSTGKFDPFTERVVDMCVHAKKVMFAMPAPLGPPIGGKFTFPTGHYLVVVIDRELGLISVIDSFPQRKRAYYEVIGGFLKSVAGQLGRYAGHGDFRLSDYTPEPGFAIQAEAFTGGLDLGPEFSNACSIMCLENLAAIAEGRKPNFDIRDVKTLRQRVARELLYGLDDRRLEDGTTRPALDIVAL